MVLIPFDEQRMTSGEVSFHTMLPLDCLLCDWLALELVGVVRQMTTCYLVGR